MRTIGLILVVAFTSASAARAETQEREAYEGVTLSDEQRTAHFMGALLGGAIGLAMPLAFLPLADNTCGGGLGASCASGVHSLIMGASMLLMPIGATVGFAAAGGHVGPGAALLGFLFSLVPASLIVLLANVTGAASSPSSALPFILSGAALSLGAMGAALYLRESTLLENPRAASGAGRVLLTAFVTIASAAVLALGGALAGLLFSGSSYLFTPLLAVAFPVIGAPLLAWVTHRGMGGKGTLLSSVLSTLIGGAIFGLTVLPAVAGSSFGSTTSALNATYPVAGAVVGILMPAIGLEISHSMALSPSEPEPRLSMGLTPVNGGALLVAGGRF